MATTDALVCDELNNHNELSTNDSAVNGCRPDLNLTSECHGDDSKGGKNECDKTLLSSPTHSTDSLEKNDVNTGALVSDAADEVAVVTGRIHGGEDTAVSNDAQRNAPAHCEEDDSVENSAGVARNHFPEVDCRNTDAWMQTDLQKSASECVLTNSKAIQMPSQSTTPVASPAHGQSLPKKHSSLYDLKGAAYNTELGLEGECAFDGHRTPPQKSNGGVKARRYSANDDQSKGMKHRHPSFEHQEMKPPKNYHRDCIPHSDGKMQNPHINRKSKLPKPNYIGTGNAETSPEKLSNGSDSSRTVKSPDAKPDWVVFEKDHEKLTNAQKSVMAKKLFAASRYKYGLTPGKGNTQRDSDGQSRINPAKQNEVCLKMPNGKGSTKRESPTDLTKVKFTYDVDPNPYSSTPGEKYLTPLQQKEKQVKELNRQIRELQQLVRERDIEIQYLTEESEQQIEFLSIEKDHTICEMQELHDYDMGQLKEKHAEEIAKLQEVVQKADDDKNLAIGKLEDAGKIADGNRETIAELEGAIARMKKEFDDKEQVHQDRYLEMYRKGQMAQEMEMEENMLVEAAKNPQNKAYKGLLKKLDKTEEELEKLKETRRHEIYSQGWQINSDPEAVIQLVRSTVYYYLIDRQPMANLSALLSILDYTEVQRRAIVEALKKKRK